MNSPWDDDQTDRVIREALGRELDDAERNAPPSSSSVGYRASRARLKRSSAAVIAASIAVAAIAAVGVALASNPGAERSDDGDLLLSTASPSTASAPTQSEGTTPAASVCEPIAPRELPNGSEPGKTVVDNAERGLYSWGEGAAKVTQLAGEDELGVAGTSEATVLRGEAWTAYAILVGDEGVGQLAFSFATGGCDYTVWLAAGTTMDAARSYVARY